MTTSYWQWAHGQHWLQAGTGLGLPDGEYLAG